jgi:hypothetical protein
MKTSRKILQIVVVAANALAASCGGGSSDALPAEWSGAHALTIQQSACRGDGSFATATFDVTATGGVIEGALNGASFRCQQSACAYVVDSGATTRVLVEPCDLHPTNVPRCACLFDLTFALPARADRTAVEVYQRSDFYGATTPPVATLLATAPILRR